MCKSCLTGLNRVLVSTECLCDGGNGYLENTSGECEKIEATGDLEISFYG